MFRNMYNTNGIEFQNDPENVQYGPIYNPEIVQHHCQQYFNSPEEQHQQQYSIHHEQIVV